MENSIDQLRLFENNKKSYLKHFVFEILIKNKEALLLSDIKMLGDEEILLELNDGRILLAHESEMIYEKNGHFGVTMLLSENENDEGILFFLLPKNDTSLVNDDFYYFLMIGDTGMIHHNIPDINDVYEIPEIVSEYVSEGKDRYLNTLFFDGGKIVSQTDLNVGDNVSISGRMFSGEIDNINMNLITICYPKLNNFKEIVDLNKLKMLIQ